MVKINNIVPLTDLQRSPGKAVKLAVETKDPVVITQHGRPAVVLIDCETFESLEKLAISQSEVGQAISERERKLRNELQRILLQIVTKLDPEKIILFGSLVHGSVRESSDIDLVIIKKTKKRYWERMKELSKVVRPRLACDFFFYTPEEWKGALAKGRSFVKKEMEGRGKVIYERAA